VEQEGTFALPEAQRDRFMLKTEMGYPDKEGELRILDGRADRSQQMPQASRVVDSNQVEKIQNAVEEVRTSSEIREYITRIGRNTRENKSVEVGVSPRGIQRLFEASRAYALVNERGFVTPQDVKDIAVDVLQHRLVLTPDAQVEDISKKQVVKDVLDSTEVPE
jgi:MoxR-like ATPase